MHIIRNSEIQILQLPILEGSIFAFGKIGSGKSVSLLSLSQGYLDNYNYKIFDLYGGDRNEGLFWVFPNNNTKAEYKLKLLSDLNEPYGKQYFINLLYPYFETKLPKYLPKKDPYVKSTLFTLPIGDIEIEDIKMVLGNISQKVISEWNTLTHNLHRKSSIHTLDALVKMLKMHKSLIYKNFIRSMVKENFLVSDYCDYNLDLIQEAKKRDVVSILCLDYIPEQYHLLIINYFLRKLKHHVDKSEIKRKNIAIIREAAKFFRSVDDNVIAEKLIIFRTNISNYIRYARTGLNFFLDCQSPWETKGLVQDAEDLKLLFRMTASRDKLEAADELRKEKRMRPDQIADLAMLDKGECYVVHGGMNVHKYKIAEPRTLYWRKEYPDFYKSMWERLGGEWELTLKCREYIHELLKDEINENISYESEEESEEETEEDDNENEVEDEKEPTLKALETEKVIKTENVNIVIPKPKQIYKLIPT